MTDLHSHILFGVDDGARNPQESIEMLQRAAQEGVTCIVATPHALHPAMDTQPARRGVPRTAALCQGYGHRDAARL